MTIDQQTAEEWLIYLRDALGVLADAVHTVADGCSSTGSAWYQRALGAIGVGPGFDNALSACAMAVERAEDWLHSPYVIDIEAELIAGALGDRVIGADDVERAERAAQASLRIAAALLDIPAIVIEGAPLSVIEQTLSATIDDVADAATPAIAIGGVGLLLGGVGILLASRARSHR